MEKNIRYVIFFVDTPHSYMIFWLYKKEEFMKFRKRICLFIVTLLALPMAFGLVSCKDNGTKTNVTAKDVYAISARP